MALRLEEDAAGGGGCVARGRETGAGGGVAEEAVAQGEHLGDVSGEKSDHPVGTRSDHARHHQNQTLATPRHCRIIADPDAPDPFFDQAPRRLKLSDDGPS